MTSRSVICFLSAATFEGSVSAFSCSGAGAVWDRFHATAVVSVASELFRLFSNNEFEMLKCDNYSRI